MPIAASCDLRLRQYIHDDLRCTLQFGQCFGKAALVSVTVLVKTLAFSCFAPVVFAFFAWYSGVFLVSKHAARLDVCHGRMVMMMMTMVADNDHDDDDEDIDDDSRDDDD